VARWQTAGVRRALLALAAITGCANYAIVDTWKGRTADDLAVAWGSPSSVQRLDDGRRIVNYEHTSVFAGMTYHCRAWFVADAAGRIAEARAEGNNGGCSRLLDGKPSGH